MFFIPSGAREPYKFICRPYGARFINLHSQRSRAGLHNAAPSALVYRRNSMSPLMLGMKKAQKQKLRRSNQP
jgi:hypothetical protein